ncbi:MAG: InlB B-repeat-containing protein [Fibromonadaceae bacterium]|jgi:hypothetical protein|nr:InlB B-repeat-containing protein [Fibromonadaceae bacterium]
MKTWQQLAARLCIKRFTMPLGAIALAILIGFSIIACSSSDGDSSEITYTLIFDRNGGTGTPPNSRNIQGGEIVTLPDNTKGMTNDNTIFDGWNTSAIGIGTHYNIGSDFTMPNSNFTLYAQWSDSTVSPIFRKPTEVNKFEAEPYIESDIKDKIKHSYSYGNYDIYYIYLGKLRNIPLFFYKAQHHNGINSTYKISSTKTTTEKITETITNSSKTVISVVDEHTTSTTTGVKISAELKYNPKFLFDLIKVEGPKVAGELYFNDYVYNSQTINSQQTTSLTNTITTGTEYTNSVTIERAWDFTKNDIVGYYRYTLFSTSDVYLYVVKDISTGVIDYEFREYIIPDSLNDNAWVLDYSENGNFSKSDDTGFKFDISMLYNLPQTKLSFTVPSAPDNVSASAQSSKNIIVSWGPVSDANSYKIYRSTSENGMYSLAGTSTSTSYTDKELSKVTTYYYKITSVNAHGSSAYSNPAYATTKDAVVRSISVPFINSGSYILPNNITYPATLEVCAIGAGGGAQGGHFSDLMGGGYGGTGGAGGGGAAAYMRLSLKESTVIGISIGNGGDGGTGQWVNWVTTWKSGNKGDNGGSTAVSVTSAGTSTTITANGGMGGGGNEQILDGGSGGKVSSRPANVSETNFATAAGVAGSNGIQGNGKNQGDIQSRGGNSGAVAIGSIGTFGGNGGAIRYAGQRPPNGNTGGGGASDISTNSTSRSGSKGGDGYAIIVITYEEEL